MKTVQDVRPIVTETIAIVFGVDDFNDQSHFSKDLGGDSLDITDLAFQLEKKLEMTLPDNEMDGLTTVGEVIAHLEAKVSSQS